MQPKLLPTATDGGKARTIKCRFQWGEKRAKGQGRVNNNSNCCCCIRPRQLNEMLVPKIVPMGCHCYDPPGGWSRSNLPSTEDAMAAVVPISY